jgi:hypothetical protein
MKQKFKKQREKLMQREQERELEQLVYADIQAGYLTYQEIIEKYPFVKNKSKLSRIKEKYSKTKEEIKKSKEKAEKEKRRKIALANRIVVQSERIAESYIDQLHLLKYGIEDLREMNEKIKADFDGLPKEVEGLIKALEATKRVDGMDKANLLKRSYIILNKLEYTPTREKLRIDALMALNKYNETASKLREDIKYATEMKALISDFFLSLNVLPEGYYKLFKERLLDLQPSSRIFFKAWEDTDQPQQHVESETEGKTEEAEIIIEENKGENNE